MVEHGNSLDAKMHLRRASDGLLLGRAPDAGRVIVEAREIRPRDVAGASHRGRRRWPRSSRR